MPLAQASMTAAKLTKGKGEGDECFLCLARRKRGGGGAMAVAALSRGKDGGFHRALPWGRKKGGKRKEGDVIIHLTSQKKKKGTMFLSREKK